MKNKILKTSEKIQIPNNQKKNWWKHRNRYSHTHTHTWFEKQTNCICTKNLNKTTTKSWKKTRKNGNWKFFVFWWGKEKVKLAESEWETARDMEKIYPAIIMKIRKDKLTRIMSKTNKQNRTKLNSLLVFSGLQWWWWSSSISYHHHHHSDDHHHLKSI